MSDFLTRMVQRTLGLAPVVQPVIPPIFAPAPIGKDYSSRQSVLADEVADGMVTGDEQGEQLKSGDFSTAPSHDSSYHTRLTIEGSPKLIRADKSSDRQSLLINQSENSAHIEQKENDRVTHHQIKPGYELEKVQTPLQQEIGSSDRDDSGHEQNELLAHIAFPKKLDDIISYKGQDAVQKGFQVEKETASQDTLPSRRDPDRVIHEQKIAINHVLSQKEMDRNKGEFPGGRNASIHLGGSPFERKGNRSVEKTTDRFIPVTVKRIMSPAMPMNRSGTGMPIVNDPSEKKPSETAPSIKVTIGRIDVRAVMQKTAPPKRKSPAEPKLSLDDYLKQRSGEQG